ncbi:MAG: PilN domain-containing protein [Phycisphaerales bacterium]|jgi:Tfp pilus assembly protein PilN
MSDVNLIPVARLARKRRTARLYIWAAVCGAYAMCLIASSATLQALRVSEDRTLNGHRSALAQQVDQDNRELTGIRKDLADARVARETTRAISHQPDWSKLFLGLSDRLGDDIVLGQCRLATLTEDNRVVGEQWAESMPSRPLGEMLKECRHSLVLNGFGKSQESVSQFVLRLEGTGVFQLVRLVSSSRQTFLDKEAVAFSVECHFKGS